MRMYKELIINKNNNIMEENKIVKTILRLIPIVGVSFFALIIVCLLFLVWGNNPILNLKIIVTSVIAIVVLSLLEKGLK